MITKSISANVQYQQHVQIKEQRLAAPPLSANKAQASAPSPLTTDEIGDTLLTNLPPAQKTSKSAEQDITSPADEESALIKLLLAKLVEFLNPDDKNNATLEMLEQDIKTLTSEQLSALNEAVIPIELDSQQENVLHIMEFKTFSQALSFSIAGEFSQGDKQITMSYQYNAESAYTYTSYRQVDLSQLKDPLIVQFGDIPLGNVKGTTEFDVNSDNTLNPLPVFNGDVGYLVYDKNHNGRADDGTELFGPQTGQGFSELAALDQDGNGFIDKNDSAYHDLYIWQPTTSKRSGRYMSLSDVGIAGINTQAHETPFTFLDRQGNIKAQMRYSSFAYDNNFQARGVHQVDVAI